MAWIRDAMPKGGSVYNLNIFPPLEALVLQIECHYPNWSSFPRENTGLNPLARKNNPSERFIPLENPQGKVQVAAPAGL